MALAFACSQPEVELAGITTVFGDTTTRAKLAKYLMSLTARTEVPVFAGNGEPIAGTAPGENIAGLYAKHIDGQEFDTGDAVEFLKREVTRQPTTLVCIGPLTNIAALIKRYPEAAKAIDEIVLMGGAYRWQATEWNIVCDPEAASIVFESGLRITAIGLDVTTKCGLSADQLAGISRVSELNRFLLDMCELWRKRTGYLPVLHDPLTFYSLLSSSDIQYSNAAVQVELSGTHTRGMTYCGDDAIWGRLSATPNARVATSLDTERFINYFLSATFDQEQ